MERYIDFIAAHRKRLLPVFALIMILAVIGIFRIDLNAGFDVFMPDHSHYQDVLDEMESYFPGSENILFIIDTGKPALDTDMISRFHEFQSYLSAHEMVNHASGPAPEIIMNGRQLIRLNRLEPEDIAGIESYYESLGDLSPVALYNGRYYGIFEAFPKDGITNDTIREIEDELISMGVDYYISGETYMQLKIFDYILKILLIIPPLALFLILFVFRTQMRSFKATVLSVLPAGVGAVWTMGLIGWIGHEISIVTVLAPIFTVVIGSADGLHFVSHVQDEEEKRIPRHEALTGTLRLVGIPMIITTVTSMAGFLVLMVMNNSAIRSLAVTAAVGILFAGLATWFVLPLILTGNVTLQTGRTKKEIARSGKQERIRSLWGRPALIIVGLLAVAAAVGIPRLTTEFNMVSLYKPATEVQKGFDIAMKVNDGSVPVFLYLEHEGDPLDPGTAEAVLGLTEQLKSQQLIGKAVSPYTLMSIMNGTLSKTAPGYPDSPEKAQSIYNIISRQKDNPLSFLIDQDAKRSRMILFPTDLDNATLDAISSEVASFESAHPGISGSLTGAQYLFRELNAEVVSGQVLSVILAFVGIYLLLLITLRSLRTSLVALLPILVTVISLYGAMGLIGLSLNLITSTIFGITIGVGIDYAIHFTFVWNAFRKDGLSADKAAGKSVAYTARPILANGFGIAIGLSALLFSPLMVHLYVAEMMWVSMVVSMFLSLTFLPTLLRKLT